MVTTVAAPEEDASAVTAEGAAAATPEVITKGKKEEGAEGAAPAAKK